MYVVSTSLQRNDSGEWNRRSIENFNSPTNTMEVYQQPQQQPAYDNGQYDYEKRRDSRPASSKGSSRSNSRPISRASSQQRFSEEQDEWKQPPRSLSRNDSQRSLTDYQQQQRQPDPIITTRINESYVEPEAIEIRKPSVTFKNDEYGQSQNLQQMAEQRSPVYTTGYQQPEEPLYTEQPYYQPQPEYDYTTTATTGYEQPQQPYYESESRRQSPEKDVYQQQQQQSRRQSPESEYYGQPTRYSDSRRQSPEQEYQAPRTAYVEPETPRRSSPPKRESPPRDDTDKIVQQRQQSREQIYGGANDATPTRQQSRDNISPDQSEKPQQKSTISIKGQPTNSTAKQMAPASPKRTANARSAKGGNEQKTGRNAMGEATGAGRKSDSVQKQPSKTVTNIRGKK